MSMGDVSPAVSCGGEREGEEGKLLVVCLGVSLVESL